ncbi:MAG: sugar transferase [Gemmatimonadetes bacterium]|nr:sugar transferase [Gemmatimonadota bacterium]
MGKRLFDVLTAAIGLALAAPILGFAALGIRLTSPGPAVYRARRIGLGGRPFLMYKLRTMDVHHAHARSRVTGAQDPRVFPLGSLLRHAKIDELPQLWNVLRGDMSIVGPRPEDPELVAEHYAPVHWDTLSVRPGLASPGALYSETHGLHMLADADPERGYLERLLPVKLALDLVYVRRASCWYDLRIVGRTLTIIAAKLAGRRRFPDPPEMAQARSLIVRRGSPRSDGARLGST